MTSNSSDTDNDTPNDPSPRIGIIGVGGAGGNAINNMVRAELQGVNFLAANTDAQALAASLAQHALQLGVNTTSGLGSGAQVATGRAAAEESIEDIRNWVSQCDLLFIAAGMGGGTGTGAAPVIADIAREEKTLSVGVITLPFDFEGSQRMRTAVEGMQELEKLVDTLIVIPNQNLFALANANTTFANAFVMADEVLHDAIRGITDLIVLPGLINLDFADVEAVITKTGRAMMGTGDAAGPSRAIDAAEAAIANPLLDIVSIKGAQGLLINVTGGPDMTLFEVDEAANRIRTEVGGDSLVIFGSAFDPSLDGNLRVSVVATGLRAPSDYAQAAPEPVAAPTPEPIPDPEPAAEDVSESESSEPPAIEPALEAVMEHAGREPEQVDLSFVDQGSEPQPVEGEHPIPAPAMPLPENPRPSSDPQQETPTPAAESAPQTIAPPPVAPEPELPVQAAPEPQKAKPKKGWLGKIFTS